MKILLVHAHPERTSVTHQLVEAAFEVLKAQGHDVMQSDLYALGWKAVFDGQDFPERANQDRLSFIEESGHAFSNGCQTPDVEEEQRKILAADAVILLFPLWWFSMPAIMKGWAVAAWRGRVERLFEDEPIAFRSQNGGDYPDRHVLADHVAPDRTGLMAHIADSSRPAADVQKNRSTSAANLEGRGEDIRDCDVEIRSLVLP